MLVYNEYKRRSHIKTYIKDAQLTNRQTLQSNYTCMPQKRIPRVDVVVEAALSKCSCLFLGLITSVYDRVPIFRSSIQGQSNLPTRFSNTMYSVGKANEIIVHTNHDIIYSRQHYMRDYLPCNSLSATDFESRLRRL